MVYFILIFLFILLLIAILIFLIRGKDKFLLYRAMNLSLFLVTVSQILEKEKEVPLENYLKTVEQFFSSLAGIKDIKQKKLFRENPYFVFEIAVPRVGEEISFYLACPRYLSETVEKLILSFWPKSQVQPISDYNIFNPHGYSYGTFVTLAKHPLFPLKPLQEFTADPLSAITNVFTKLAKEGEGAAFQILIRPTKKTTKKETEGLIKFLQKGMSFNEALDQVISGGNFFKSIFKEFTNIIFFSAKKEEKEVPKMSFENTPFFQNQLSAISQKASLPAFEVNIRLLSSAPSEGRAKEILNQLQTAFEQFNSPTLNQIKFIKLSPRQMKKLFYRFSFRIFSEKEKILLSSSELATIFHFPSPNFLTPQIKWLKARQAPAPPNLPEEGIIIGKNVFRSQEKVVHMLDDDRRRHFYIIGQTGTGKSVLLQELVRQDILMGKGVALIDPHGDLAERVLTFVPPERAEDVIYFNPSDYERPIGLNMLEYDPRYPEGKTFVVNELLEIFEKLYNLKAMGFGGPMFEQYMRNALLLVMEDPESGNTLVDVPRVLADAYFRRYKLSKCQNIVVKNFWEMEAEKAGGEAALANMVPYITSKMNVFIANDLVRPIIAQQKSTINFREIMDESKILIVNLSKGKLGDINSYLLGMIIVGKILLAAFSRADLPEEKRRDFYLYIDEFQNVTTATITQVLAEARKYRLSMIFAHQFIGQLDENTQKAIFGNVGSILAFRVGPDDAKYLVTQFQPVFDEQDLVNLDNYNGALRLLIKGETAKPFNIVTFPPSKGDPKIAELIKKYSRVKYGKERDAVEAELRERLSKRYF